MVYLQDWLAAVPLLLALLVFLYVPGLLVLRLADVRRNVAFGVAPAVTCGLVGVGGILLGLLGVRWNLISFFVITLAACGLVLTYRAVLRRMGQEQLPIGGQVAVSRWTVRQRVVVGAALAAAVLLHWVPILHVVDPNVPSALSDPMFHYNGINAVMNTGDSSMFGAMNWNYGPRVLEVTYPSVWHALAALVASPTGVVGVAHVFSYLVTPVIFLAGMTSLGTEVFPLRRLMAVLTPLIAAAFVAFPDYMTVGKGFWPNALALALFPGILALAAATIFDIARGRLDRHLVRYVGSALILLAGIAGLVLSHPTFIFSLVWVGAPVLVVMAVRLKRRTRAVRHRPRFLAVSAVAAVVIVVGTLTVLRHPQVQAAMSRPGIGEWEQFVPRLASAIVLWPASPNTVVMLLLAAFYGSVTLLGILIAARSQRARWVLAAWVMQGLLILGVYFPIPLLSNIAGLWYSDVYRLFAVQVVFLPLLLSIPLGALWSSPSATEGGEEPVAWPRLLAPVQKLAGRTVVRVAVVLFLIAHLTVGTFVSQSSVNETAAPAIGEGNVLGSEDELDLLRGLDKLVPEGSLVLGDPLTGIGYAPPLSDVDSVFTQVSIRSLDHDGKYLAENFADIHEEPEVCEIVRHYGITHYYEDAAVAYEGELRDESLPGLYGVDTSAGFTEIASAGEATLWRIDACGEIESRADWWNEEWRRDTVVDDADG